MRKPHRYQFRPRVESLESLLPLSGAGGAATAVARPAAPLVRAEQVAAQAVILQGTIRGGYSVVYNNGGLGGTFRFGLGGRLNPIGPTGSSGIIGSTGTSAAGRAVGSINLSSPRGGLKLEVDGTVTTVHATLPTTMTFTIVGGTRAYRNAVGSGTIVVTLRSTYNTSRVGGGLITLNFQA